MTTSPADLNLAAAQAALASVEPFQPPAGTALTEALEQKAVERIVFPETGLIDPTAELEQLRQIALAMPEEARRGFPDQVRQRILDHHHKGELRDSTGNQLHPPVDDHDLKLAVYLKKLADSPLTNEQLEIKATKNAKAAKPKNGDLFDLMNKARVLQSESDNA